MSSILVEVAKACQKFHDENVMHVNSKKVQCYEIWSFVYAKDKNVERSTKTSKEGAGDARTWVGIDADSKLVLSFFVGNRDAKSANEFMLDVASRVRNRIQLTTDGHRPYLRAIENAFDDDIDFAQLIKIYGQADGFGNEKRYSPAECIG